MDVVALHMHNMTLAETRKLVKDLGLRKQMPKRYTELTKADLAQEIKKHVVLRRDNDVVYLANALHNTYELKPKEIKSRKKKTEMKSSLDDSDSEASKEVREKPKKIEKKSTRSVVVKPLSGPTSSLEEMKPSLAEEKTEKMPKALAKVVAKTPKKEAVKEVVKETPMKKVKAVKAQVKPLSGPTLSLDESS